MKEKFMTLFSKYVNDIDSVNEIWNEIEVAYSGKERAYHTLEHLKTMFEIIAPYEGRLENKEAVLLAVWFHDVVYNTGRTDNEEKSAAFYERMAYTWKLPVTLVNSTVTLILLTKKHMTHEDENLDTKLFLDADLSVLGSDAQTYQRYQEGIRKEYAQYPDLLYRVGRKKVVKAFLEVPYLYNTSELREQLEERAKKNLLSELKQLS